MTPEDIQSRIETVSWYHSYDLCGVITPGRLRIDPSYLDMIGVPASLGNQKVLEVGAWDGAYTWELERRGPAELHALDIQDPNHTGFNVAKGLLRSKAQYHHCSIYDMQFKDHFDIVIYMGVYYHLKQPMIGFQKIWEALVPGGIVFVEGAVMVQNQIDGHPVGGSFCHFGPVGRDQSMWFTPNLTCLTEWIKYSGFEVLEAKVVANNPRAVVVAKKDPEFSDFEHEVV